MSPRVDMGRRDLDPDQLANLLRAIQTIYDDYDVERCNATTLLGELRLNITIRKRLDITPGRKN